MKPTRLAHSTGTTPDDVREAYARMHTRLRFVLAAHAMREFAPWMLHAIAVCAHAADVESSTRWYPAPPSPTADDVQRRLRRGRR